MSDLTEDRKRDYPRSGQFQREMLECGRRQRKPRHRPGDMLHPRDIHGVQRSGPSSRLGIPPLPVQIQKSRIGDGVRLFTLLCATSRARFYNLAYVIRHHSGIELALSVSIRKNKYGKDEREGRKAKSTNQEAI